MATYAERTIYCNNCGKFLTLPDRNFQTEAEALGWSEATGLWFCQYCNEELQEDA